MKKRRDIYFKEVQRFREAWLWWVLVCSVVASIVAMVAGGMMEQETPMNTVVGLAIIVPMQAVLLTGFFIAKLETNVSEAGVQYRFYPFQIRYRVVSAAEIHEFYVRDAPKFKRGISRVFGYGWTYTTSGGKGIQFHLKSGRKVFIGSQRVPSLRSAVENLMELKH